MVVFISPKRRQNNPNALWLPKRVNLKDHLGNVRVVFADKNQDGKINPSNELLQENHFYPFGIHKDDFSQNYATTGATNRYDYNGKELNGDLGLDLHDYGARWYDASMGKWNAVDPLAEKYYPINSYVYVANNPLKFIDPDGMQVVMFYDKNSNSLYVVDLDHWEDGRETKTVNSEDYMQFEKGKSTHNQILKVDDVFSGGNNMNDNEDLVYGTDEKEVAIPDGDYSILEYEGAGTRAHWYRLDKQDSSPHNDKAEGYKNAEGKTRGEFRLHIGRRSHGCVTLTKCSSNDRKEEFSVINKILKNTSRVNVRDRQGFVNKFKEKRVDKYGEIIVQ